MDGEEEVLVCRGANDVGGRQELPREDGGVAQEVGDEDLQTDHAGDDVLGERLGAAELGDLRVTPC